MPNVDKYLVDSYDYIFKNLFYRCYDAGLAQDLRGDVIEKVLKNKKSFKGDFTNFKAWVHRICFHVYVDHYRKFKNKEFIKIDSYLHPTYEFKYEDIDLLEKCMEIVSEFSDRDKLMFDMHFQGYKYKEISEELEIPLGTVKNLLHKMKNKLKIKI